MDTYGFSAVMSLRYLSVDSICCQPKGNEETRQDKTRQRIAWRGSIHSTNIF